jgi:hypothetical protein
MDVVVLTSSRVTLVRFGLGNENRELLLSAGAASRLLLPRHLATSGALDDPRRRLDDRVVVGHLPADDDRYDLHLDDDAVADDLGVLRAESGELLVAADTAGRQ